VDSPINLEIIKKSSFRVPTRKAIEGISEVVLQYVAAAKLKRSARRRLEQAEALRLVFVSAKEMRRLNREFRDKDYATDILSFAAEPGVLGELVLSLEVLGRQAREHEMTLDEELQYMILHGVLHLLGYDHETNDKAARQMYRLQDRIFVSFKEGSYGHRHRVVRHKK
jgi:probable rRNA maturation factor